MSGILILGSGGHGKVVADILRSAGCEVAGFLDDAPGHVGMRVLDLPILGTVDGYAAHRPSGLILGIGANHIRQRIAGQLGSAAAQLWCNAIHPRATVAQSARLGRGVVVAAGAVINPDAVIGDHAIINTGATVDHDSIIGDYAHVAPGAHLAGQVTVGAGVLIGVGAAITPSCSIGDWAVVGAGAVVVRDIPASVRAKGVPARW
jgi:sugar O-acyltransferase (sialic acid O-acetyltransferase NeuD family)